MDIKPIHILVVALAIGLLASMSYIDIPGITPDGTTDPTDTGDTGETGLTVIRSAKAQWNIRDKLTKIATASGDTGYVGIVRADANGNFDLLDPVEETEFDAAPDTSSGTYRSGDELLIAVSSDNDPTGGYETYPRWFYIESLADGASIKALPLRNPISAISGTPGNYKVNGGMCEDTGYDVAWLTGTTPYWVFGDYFELYGRVAKDYLIQQITNKGVVGCTLNDGATWEDTDAEINANFTLTADTEDLYFELVGEAADVAFGLPALAVGSNGEVKQYNAVVIWATDAIGMADLTGLFDDGWVQISKPDMTADIAFYRIIDPVADGCIPSTGNVINCKIPISISDSGLVASTEYEYEGWVLDWQVVSYVASGITTTTVPSGNGFISEVGSDTVVEPLALTISSGSVATMQLLGHFTTNA
jgi:hypothetical protein